MFSAASKKSGRLDPEVADLLFVTVQLGGAVNFLLGLKLFDNGALFT
jgi:hypothetical protein